MQSTCPGVLTVVKSCVEKVVLVVLEEYFKLDPRSESTILSSIVLTSILSAHDFS